MFQLRPHTLRSLLSVGIVVAAGLLPISSAGEILSTGPLRLGGDFRLRAESDFDSRTADRTRREDRDRLRVRLRINAAYQASESWDFGLRLRSGSRLSGQSTHITLFDFDGGPSGDWEFNFDKAYARTRSDRAWLWVGRNSLPLWKQNELFWDDDVTPVGLGLGYRDGNFSFSGGYFALPVGLDKLSGTLAAAQGVYQRNGSTVALGFWRIQADPDDADAARLLRNNGFRDYSVALLALQHNVGKLTLGLDYAQNFDPEAGPLQDQVEALVITVGWGAAQDKGDWHWRYTFARVEALAVSSSYAEDDWVRWGSATQTRATDFQGHELRAVYGLGHGQNLTLRFYQVQAITSDENGSRLRLDYNYRF